jgi:outer membrane protein
MRSRSWALVFAGGALLFTASPVKAEDTEESPPVPKLQVAAPETARLETITLTEAVHRALLRNPSAQVAAQEIERAGALLEEVRASSLPSLIANGTYTRLDSDRVMTTTVNNVTSSRTIASKNQFSANLNLSVPLIAPQRWVLWSQAAANLRTSESSNQDVRRTVALATARAYLTVIAQKRTVDTNNRAVATDRAHYEFAHTRFQGGVGNRVDDVRAAQQLAADESLLAASYTALARAREALAVLVGQDQPVDVFDDVNLGSASTDPEEAVAKRKDVVAAKARLSNAEKVKRESWADYTPALTGQFMPFAQTSTLTTPETGWQALLVLNFPLYEGGLRRGQSHERAALVSEARAQYEALTRQTRSDIRLAVESIRRAEQALSSAKRAADLAREALSLSTLAYQAGATTNIEVIDAERRARDTEAAMVLAEDSLRQARLDLLAAAGQFP